MGSVARTSPYILGDTDRSWDLGARCRGDRDPERFFRDEEASVEFCHGCLVMDDCLRWALVTDQKTGVWGGKTEKERSKMVVVTPAAPVGLWPSCPKGLHEMTPERVTTGGECRACSNIRNAEYRAKSDLRRYVCPVCHRKVAVARGRTTLAQHKDYSRDGAYCPQRAIPTEVEQ